LLLLVPRQPLLLWVSSCLASPLLLQPALLLVLRQAQEAAVPAALLLLLAMLHADRSPLLQPAMLHVGRSPLLLLAMPLLQEMHAQMLTALLLPLLPAACRPLTDHTREYGSHQHLHPRLLAAPGCTATAPRLPTQPAPSTALTP
jgi:hypothetical protein